jgi:hypothetical protein
MSEQLAAIVGRYDDHLVFDAERRRGAVPGEARPDPSAHRNSRDSRRTDTRQRGASPKLARQALPPR